MVRKMIDWRSMCAGLGCAGLCVSLSVQAASVRVPSVAYGQRTDIAVEGSAEAGGFVVGGTLRKTGAGTLTVTNALFTGGELEVAQGSAVLAADASLAAFPRPEWLFVDDNLLFWLDATTNVVDESGMVTRWHDVRETNVAAAVRLYAGRWQDEPGPALASTNWLGASSYLEFGVMQSNGCWLSVMKPNANGTVTSNHSLSARSVFAVRGTKGSGNGFHGFFFGGWNGTGNGGTKDFHVGSSSGAPSSLWNVEATLNLQRAVTSLDGRPVNGTITRPNDWFQLVGLQLSPVWAGSSVQLSNFFNDRNYHQPTTNFRQGGGQLAEVLVFTTALSEEDRAAVEGYLLAKWVRRSQDGAVRANAGAQAVFAVGQGEALTLGGVCGEGSFSKTGDGVLQLRKFAQLPPRKLLLEGGSIAVSSGVARTDFMLDVAAGFGAGGMRLTADGALFSGAALAAEAGVLAKDGGGTWTLAEIPAGVSSVRVEEGTLRLMPRRAVLPATPIVSASVPNHDFEASTLSAGQYGYGASLAGWTFEGQTKIDEGAGQVDKGAGVARQGGACPWIGLDVKTVDGGAAVVFIQRQGTCATTVTLPEAGRYRLTFAHASRTSTAANKHLLEVVFDGAPVVRFETAAPAFACRTVLLPYKPAGAYPLRFDGVYLQTGDRTSLIDDIRVTRVPDDNAENLVPDGSFEAPVALPSYLTAQTRYAEGSAITHPDGWSFSDPVVHVLSGQNPTNYASSGIAENTWSDWMLPPPDGARCAFIFSDGRVSVPLTFPTGGVYRLTFQGAGGGDNSRFSTNSYGATPNALLPLNILLDGTNAVSLTLQSPVFQPFDVLLPPVTNNQTAVLTFAGATGTNALTRVGLIDDVRVAYAGPVAFANAGFESGSVEWDFMTATESGNPDIKSGIDSAYGSWVNRIESGARVAYLQQTASISQDVTFPEAGTYTVSFLAAARSERERRFVGHDFAIQWDGKTVGTVKTEDYLFTRYTFRLPHVAAGTHTLTFQGINTRGVDTASTIDDVRVARLAVEDAAYEPIPDGLTVEIAEGATLALDFAGVRPLHRLRIGGRLASGLVSAASHPGAIMGAGALQVPNAGTLILLH